MKEDPLLWGFSRTQGKHGRNDARFGCGELIDIRDGAVNVGGGGQRGDFLPVQIMRLLAVDGMAFEADEGVGLVFVRMVRGEGIDRVIADMAHPAGDDRKVVRVAALRGDVLQRNAGLRLAEEQAAVLIDTSADDAAGCFVVTVNNNLAAGDIIAVRIEQHDHLRLRGAVVRLEEGAPIATSAAGK